MSNSVRAVIFLHFEGNGQDFEVLRTIKDMIIPESLFLLCFFESSIPDIAQELLDSHGRDVPDANSRRFHAICSSALNSCTTLILQYLDSMHTILPAATKFFCVLNDYPQYVRTKLSQIMSTRSVEFASFRKEADLTLVYDLHKTILDLCVGDENIQIFRSTLDNLIVSFRKLPDGASFNHETFGNIELLKTLPFSPLLLLNSLARMRILNRDKDGRSFILRNNNNASMHPYQHEISSNNQNVMADYNHSLDAAPARSNQQRAPKRQKSIMFYEKLLAFLEKHEHDSDKEKVKDMAVDKMSGSAEDSHFVDVLEVNQSDDDGDTHFVAEQHFVDIPTVSSAKKSSSEIENLQEFLKYHRPESEIVFDIRKVSDPITGDEEGYICRIIVDDESFESSAQKTKQLTQEHCARFAMKYFNEYLACAVKTGALQDGSALTSFLPDCKSNIHLNSTVSVVDNTEDNVAAPKMIASTEIDTTAMPLFNEYVMKTGSSLPEFEFKNSLDGMYAGKLQFYKTFETIKIHKKKTDVKNDIAAQILVSLGKKLRDKRELQFSSLDFEK